MPPTAAELQAILDNITPRYRAAVILAAWAGVRYDELTELRVKDLERVEDVYLVNVARAVTHVTGQGFIEGDTKSEAGVRTIVLPPHVTHIVEAHLRDDVLGFPDSPRFPAADGVTNLSQTTFYKYWDPAGGPLSVPTCPGTPCALRS